MTENNKSRNISLGIKISRFDENKLREFEKKIGLDKGNIAYMGLTIFFEMLDAMEEVLDGEDINVRGHKADLSDFCELNFMYSSNFVMGDFKKLLRKSNNAEIFDCMMKKIVEQKRKKNNGGEKDG